MSDEHPRTIRTDIPHPARIWNYWMGGGDYYEVDRIAADAGSAVYPGISTLAKESRRFLFRAVRYLAAEKGIRQFLDIGTGLPTAQNTHEVAQSVAPESRIVYVDNDPVVLAHARTLLTSTTDEGVTTYIDTDYHHPEIVVADARHILNLTRPVAVMFMGVLGHAQRVAEMRRIVHTVLESTTAGATSYSGTAPMTMTAMCDCAPSTPISAVSPTGRGHSPRSVHCSTASSSSSPDSPRWNSGIRRNRHPAASDRFRRTGVWPANRNPARDRREAQCRWADGMQGAGNRAE